MNEDVWKATELHETYIPCTCFTCGKVFVPPLKTMWAYKRTSKENFRLNGESRLYFCSYGCMRQYDKDHPRPAEMRGRKKKEAPA